MNLIEVYIHEVTRRVPEKGRADIALELRSTIEDMLHDNYSEKDVKEVLEKLGNPATLASGYRDQPMHLIGPRYFDIYVSLLKMIVPIAAVISLIAMIAEYFIGYSGDEAILNVVLNIMGVGIGSIIEVGVQVFFWLTLIFAIIERTDKGKDQQPLTASLKKWTPDDLKNIPFIPKEKAIKKFEVFGSLMWTAIWATLYFYANQLVGVYENGGGGVGLEFVIPALNQDILLRYWPFVLVIIALEIGLALYKLIKGQWTKKMAIFNTVLELSATVVCIFILSNPKLMNQEFISYMNPLFNTTANQFETWIVGGLISIFIITSTINVFSGYRKARIR
ncbi:HAAS signaling domain-containing protein [Peribacillus sp. NPDC097295]|uniref:HAAS signaling domain-containing protein n=1 Tax=Peribacillus sp. NPDC097295 TaxID=3364402 RepID=UPI0037FE8C99